MIGPGHVLTPHGSVTATVRVEDGRVTAVEPVSTPVDRVIAPGFVDLQVNGMDDVDVARADGSDWDRLDDLLAATGVTSWLPTLISGPLDAYADPLARIAEAAARTGARPRVLGAHLEGPFLGGLHGAHPPAHVVALDLDWLASRPSTVRLVTLGPEQPDAVSAVRLLTGRGVVVSLGHSAADAERSLAAVEAGASMVTHLFNAMGPLHHREPGLVGVALADHRVTAGIIPDLVHVHPTVLRMAVAAKGPDRIAAVTDAVAWRAGGLADVGIEVRDGAPRLPDGTIAGSCLTMDRAVRNLVEHAGIPPADAVRAASTTPARVIGAHDCGRIEVGARADLVVLGADDLAVRETVVAGRTVWEA